MLLIPRIIKETRSVQRAFQFEDLKLVGRVGIEPTRYLYRRILSPLRLPVPPPPLSGVF